MDGERHTEPNEYHELLSDETLQNALTAVSDLVIVISADRIIERVASSDQVASTVPPAHLSGRPITSLVPDDPSWADNREDDVVRRLLDPDNGRVTVPVATANGDTCLVSFVTVDRQGQDGVVCLGTVTAESAQCHPGRQSDSVFDLVADPAYVLDAADRIKRVNDAFVDQTGYDREALHGREIVELFGGESCRRATADHLKTIDADSERVETQLTTRDGNRIFAEIAITTLTGADGTYAGAVGVIRDIAEYRRREQNLEAVNDILTRVLRHNVRNGLSVVDSHAEVLAERVNNELQTHTGEILNVTSRLSSHSRKARLVTDIVEADNQHECRLVQATRDVVRDIRETSPEATIEVELSTEVVVDAHRHISQAIRELIENAIEHAPDDESAHVEIWLDHRGDSQTLFIEDRSGGLSDHEITVLRRGNEHRLKHSTGVGLWLVRWIVERSDAEMIVHRTNAGSLFGIQFSTTEQDDTPTSIVDSSLVRAPADVHDTSVEQFRGKIIVDRTEPLARLTEMYDSALRSGGRFVFVTGEAGVGKTTLIERFRARLDTHDVSPTVATGQCRSASGSAYDVFRQVFRTLPTDRSFSAIVAAVAGEADSNPRAVEQNRQQLFEDVADSLRAIATDQPVVLCLEDLHQADQGVVDLLDYLIEDIGHWGVPIVFVGSYRPEDLGQAHPVGGLAEEAAESGRGAVVQLGSFEIENTKSLLSHTLESSTLPASFVQATQELTGGTALFVNELAQQLADRFAPVGPDTELPESAADLPVPETVEQAITRRLEQLPADVEPVLSLGAVLGQTFSFELLREASEQPVGTVAASVETLTRQRIWTQSGDTLEFGHGFVRERARARLDADDRETLHEQAAAAIETIYQGELEEHTNRLASHHEQAGNYEQAFDYYRRTATRAVETYANDEAITHYERALQLADDHDVGIEDVRATVLSNLGSVHERRGEYDHAEERYREAREIAAGVGDREEEATTLRNLGTVAARQGLYEQAQSYYEESLALTRELEDQDGEAAALNNLGIIALRRGETDLAVERFEASLQIRRAAGDRMETRGSLRNLGAALKQRGDIDRARECLEESLAISRERGDELQTTDALDGLGSLADRRGAYDEAEAYYRECLQIEREAGDRGGEAGSLHNLGKIAAQRGAYDEARQRYDDSLAIRREIGETLGVAQTLHGLGSLARHRGAYDRARELYDEALSHYRELGSRSEEASVREAIGQLIDRQGRHDTARESLEESLEIYETLGEQGEVGYTLRSLGRNARHQGELEQAAEYLTEAIDCARENSLRKLEMETLRELGALARERGAYDEAERRLTNAREMASASGCHHQRARVHLERARLSITRGSLETAAETIEQADEAVVKREATHDQGHAAFLRGRVAARTGSPESARNHWEAALDTFETVGAPHDALRTLERLVELCQEQGDNREAERYKSNARSLCETVTDEVQSRYGQWLD